MCTTPTSPKWPTCEVIRCKTAKLFEAAARLGAILGGASPEIEAGFAAYGMHLGTAFQLVDDVLDYSGDLSETGKHLGDDLAEGKPTLPLIYAMQHGHPGAGGSRAPCHRAGRAGRVRAGARRDPATGALDYARQQARSEAAGRVRCASGAATIQTTAQSLLELAAFAVERRTD